MIENSNKNRKNNTDVGRLIVIARTFSSCYLCNWKLKASIGLKNIVQRKYFIMSGEILARSLANF